MMLIMRMITVMAIMIMMMIMMTMKIKNEREGWVINGLFYFGKGRL